MAVGVAVLLGLAIGGPGLRPVGGAAASETTVRSLPLTSPTRTQGSRTTPPPATTPSTARSPLTSRSPVTSGPSGTSRPALNPSPSTVFQPPPVTYAYLTTPTYYYPPPSTTAAPTTTSTTIAPIGGHLPVPPSTVPLRTKAQSAHVSPVFAALSGAGFLAAFLIMAGRFILTRPGRKP